MTVSQMPVWETAVWVVWPRALWMRWQLSVTLLWATVCAMSTAFSAKNWWMAGRQSFRTFGCPADASGCMRFRKRRWRCTSAAMWKNAGTTTTMSAFIKIIQRLWQSPAICILPAWMARAFPACVCGKAREKASTWGCLIPATICARWSRTPWLNPSPKCCTPRTITQREKVCA